jgi:hypothetical protein
MPGKKAIVNPDPTTVGFDEAHPYKHDVEEAVLGSVLIDPDCFHRLAAILNAYDFYIARHTWVWEAFEHLIETGSKIDYLTVQSELERTGKLEEVGGPAFLMALANRTPSSLHAEVYANLVREDSARRSILINLRAAATQVVNPGKSMGEILETLLAASKQATGSPTASYSVRSGLDAMIPRPAVKYLLEKLIYEKSVTVLYGDGGTKKTWSAIYLGVCISNGIPFGDLETSKTPVLYIDEEIGETEMDIRTAFCIRGSLTEANENFKYISLAPFYLDDPQGEAILLNEILSQKSGLVIFDALSELMTGDENSKEETQPVFNAMRRIADKTGAAILMIHHASKDKKNYRGSTVIRNAPDILIRIESEEDSDFINFKTEKNRKNKVTKWAMHATWTENLFYLEHSEGTKRSKPLSKSCEFVIRYLTANHASELQAIVGAADTCTPKAAQLAIYKLVNLGIVFRTNPSDSDRVKAIYDLTKEFLDSKTEKT